MTIKTTKRTTRSASPHKVMLEYNDWAEQHLKDHERIRVVTLLNESSSFLTGEFENQDDFVGMTFEVIDELSLKSSTLKKFRDEAHIVDSARWRSLLSLVKKCRKEHEVAQHYKTPSLIRTLESDQYSFQDSPKNSPSQGEIVPNSAKKCHPVPNSATPGEKPTTPLTLKTPAMGTIDSTVEHSTLNKEVGPDYDT